MVTVRHVNTTLQSVLQKLPIPNRVWLKPPMMWSNSPGGMSERGSVQEVSDCCAWPVIVPTCILADTRSMLVTVASVLKYQPLALESTMAVLMRALSIAVLALVTRHVAWSCSHLAFHLFSGDTARRTAESWGRTDAATRMFGAGGGGL